MNEFQLIQVSDYLTSNDIKDYTVRPGNNCIWVSYGMVDCYFIFRNDKLEDVIYD